MVYSPNIRLALPDEKSALEELQLRASLANQSVAASENELRELIEVPLRQILDEQVLVVEQNSTTLGFAVLLPISAGVFELDGLFVEPSQWRRGLGRKLLDFAKCRVINCGASCIHVTANPDAVPFYEAYGFVETGRKPLAMGWGIEMKLSIQA